MKPVKTTNAKARIYVQTQTAFEANNMWGTWIGKAYVVYSYGVHWPMFIFAEGTWFENEGKYSVTTSKHQSQTRPTPGTFKVSHGYLQQMVDRALEGSKIVRL